IRKLLFILTAAAVTGCGSSDDPPAADDADVAPQIMSEQPSGGAAGDTTGADGAAGDPTGPNGAGDNGGTLSDGAVSILGYMAIGEDESFEEVQVIGAFSMFPEPYDAQFVQQSLTARQPDSCEVSIYDPLAEDLGDDIEEIFSPTGFEYLSAGEVITLSGPSGTYGEVLRFIRDSVIFYTDDGLLPYPAPETLSIDIPGDQFPAFSNLTIDRPAAVANFNFENDGSQPVNAGSEFTWTANPGANTWLSLDLYTNRPSPDGDQLVEVSCFLEDDGAFVLPQSTRDEVDALLGAGWTMPAANLYRESFIFRQEGSVLLVIFRGSDI
ncbi:MAG: hypothetical protein KTR32_31655, partial [Granulosicoccus sp.]|nr:hypothetical protein [Granulosicoccus sp.]